MVSSPWRMRSSEYCVAAAGARISIVRPSVSCSARYSLHLRDERRVVRAGLVEPEHGGRAGRAGAGDGELHPVAHRDVLRLRRAPDVARLRRRARGARRPPGSSTCTTPAAAISNVLSWLPYSSAACAMSPTFGHGADRGGVERAVRDDVVDGRLVDARVRRVGDDGEGVVLAAVDAPQLAAVADERGHRGIHDHVGGHVQVRDALVGVDVRQARTAREVGA